MESSTVHDSHPEQRHALGIYRSLFMLAIRRPSLIPALIGAGWAFRRRDWYRRPPFLPLPSASFLRWRVETAYGDPDAQPPGDEMERFLRWARRMRRGR